MAAQRADRLPIWRTVAEAFAVTARNSDYLFRISWMWVLVMLPIAFVYHLTAFRHGWVCTSHPCPSGSDAYPIGSTLLFMPMLSSIAVAWHRRLLADEVWQGRYYLRLDRSVAGYFVWLCWCRCLLSVPPMFLCCGQNKRCLRTGLADLSSSHCSLSLWASSSAREFGWHFPHGHSEDRSSTFDKRGTPAIDISGACSWGAFSARSQ